MQSSANYLYANEREPLFMENNPPSPSPSLPTPTAPDDKAPTKGSSGFAAILRKASSYTGQSEDSLSAVGMAFLYILFYLITPQIPSSHIAVVALTTLISLPLVLLFTVYTARAIRTSTALIWNFVIVGLLILPSILIPLLVFRFPEYAPFWGKIGPYFRIYRRTLAFIPGLNGLLMVWFACCIGVLVSRLVKEMKLLLPMAAALAMVDLYVVFGGGAVAQAQSGQSKIAEKAMEALTVKLPTTQVTSGAAPAQLAVGFADFLFIALFFACFRRFNIPSRRTFKALNILLVAYMIVVAISRLPLPALVPIAVVVIGMNFRRFKYDRSEAFALLYAGLLVLCILGGMVFLSRR